MKDYKKTYCIEGGYFDCPKTLPPVIEKKEDKRSEVISRELPLSTDHYSKSTVKKRTTIIYDRKK